MEGALKYEISNFNSAILINKGDQNMQLVSLPTWAQIAPIRSMRTMDINKDGYLDILATGNLFPAEVETVRYDAGIGLTMLGDGKGGFSEMPVAKSGFFTPYDARSIEILKDKDNRPIILVGNNRERLQIFTDF